MAMFLISMSRLYISNRLLINNFPPRSPRASRGGIGVSNNGYISDFHPVVKNGTASFLEAE